MIRIKNAEVTLTEQTVKELVNAIEKAKNETKFISKSEYSRKAMYDMTPEQYNLLQKSRGQIRVKSEFSRVEFVINIEVNPNTQESLGYKLV